MKKLILEDESQLKNHFGTVSNVSQISWKTQDFCVFHRKRNNKNATLNYKTLNSKSSDVNIAKTNLHCSARPKSRNSTYDNWKVSLSYIFRSRTCLIPMLRKREFPYIYYTNPEFKPRETHLRFGRFAHINQIIFKFLYLCVKYKHEKPYIWHWISKCGLR